MIVSSITPLDKRRCKVLMDEGFALVLYRGEIKKYGLEEDGECSKELYDEILNNVLCKRARQRIIHLLKSMDKTEEELRRKLKDGGYPQEAVDWALDFVKKMGYVNDKAYAERYAECFAGRKSKKQIAFDLGKKGIDRETIAGVMEETEVDEDAQIKELLEKRKYFQKMEEKEEDEKERFQEYRRTAAFLTRKGFSWEAVKRALGEVHTP